MSVTDEIKQRIDIVEFISRHTPLKKTGSTYKGPCPFHTERTPSFVVFPQTNTWHCFGACGVGGDIFSFLMRKENIEFREALEILAREAGVEIVDDAGDSSRRQRSELYAVNEIACTYFRQILHTHSAAAIAREYVQRRGIDADTEELFQLGYALDTWDSLRDYLTSQGYDLELQIEAGLVKRHEERDSVYDAFRGRLIIPIRDRQGRVIGFGGRILGDGQPKYLNTSETPVFHKSHVIYGLDMAYDAIRTANQVVVVEGYMDVIAAHQFGFSNVVACMGTALTTEQLQQLQRYTSEFVLALDADNAGQQATIRGLNQARQSLSRVRKPAVAPGGGLRLEERLGANLYISSMPDGRDPDDVIRDDPETWRSLIASAKPLVDFYFSVVGGQVDLSTARGKGLAVAELAPLIAELEDEIEREHYVQQLSRLVQVDEQTIAGRVQAAAKTNQVSQRPKRPERFKRPTPARDIQDDGASENANPLPVDESHTNLRTSVSSEDYLLANLLREPDLLVWLTGMAVEYGIRPPQAEDWRNVENQEIFRALKRFIASDEQWDLELFQDELTGHLHGRLAHLLAAGVQLPDRNQAELRTDIAKVLVRLRIDWLANKSTQVKFLIDEAQRNGDQTTAREYFVINNQSLRELWQLQHTFGRLSRVLLTQGRPDSGVNVR